jgi:hypothetical protein
MLGTIYCWVVWTIAAFVYMGAVGYMRYINSKDVYGVLLDETMGTLFIGLCIVVFSPILLPVAVVLGIVWLIGGMLMGIGPYVDIGIRKIGEFIDIVKQAKEMNKG